MNESEQKKRDWKVIIGLIALIAVLFVSIQLIFGWLGQVIPPEAKMNQDTSQSQTVQEPGTSQSGADRSELSAPSFCPFCGEELPASFQWGQYCPWCGEQVEA